MERLKGAAMANNELKTKTNKRKTTEPNSEGRKVRLRREIAATKIFSKTKVVKDCRAELLSKYSAHEHNVQRTFHEAHLPFVQTGSDNFHPCSSLTLEC